MYCRYITGAKKIKKKYLKKMTYSCALKTAVIGYGHVPYTSAFESAGIGRTYSGSLKAQV